jgi:phage tail sheath protein FI
VPYTPVLAVDDATLDTLDGAGISAWQQLTGFGTVLMGCNTLGTGIVEQISVARTLDFLQRSIDLALEPVVFLPNDQSTWSQLTTGVTGFLQDVFVEGGLWGTTASDAFTVSCGIPATMSAQTVQNGDLVLDVSVTPTATSGPIVMRFIQQSGT